MRKLSGKAIITNSLGTLITAVFVSIGIFAVLLGEDGFLAQTELSAFWFIVAIILGLIGAIGYSVLWVKLFGYEIGQNEFKKEYGVISKSYVSIPYGRVQNVNIQRGLLERMLGISTVEIQTAGNEVMGQAEGRLPGVDKTVAEQVREAILDKSRPNRGAQSSGDEGVPQPGL